MKTLYKLLLVLVLMAVSTGGLWAQNTYVTRYVAVDTLWDDVALDGTPKADTTAAFDLTGPNVGHGYFSVFFKTDQNGGTSDVTLTYQLSFDGGTTWAYEYGTGATTTIVTGQTGALLMCYLLEPMPAPDIRFIATAGAANTANIDIHGFMVRHPLAR